MTDNITALIAEARAIVNRGWFREGYPSLASVITRLADALEATVKEMHARELHHFEEEQARAEAEAERDRYRAEAESARKTGERILADALRYRAALEDIQAEQQDYTVPHDEALSNIGTILARALNENGEN